MNYYKAVRPDGTDFATGTTRPVVGEWMTRIDGRLKLCERGYHVSDAPAETLIGGSWPCRLFEVEIAEDVPPENVFQHKHVVHTYRPIRELPAWQALGPNGEAVVAFIKRAKSLSPDEAKRLDDAYAFARAATSLEAAWAAAWDASLDAAWDNARDAARDAAWDTARSPTRDAAWALVVRDLLTPEQFNTLYGPWASVIESA